MFQKMKIKLMKKTKSPCKKILRLVKRKIQLNHKDQYKVKVILHWGERDGKLH